MSESLVAVEVQRPSLVSSTISALRGRITTGVWPVGSRIPPEPELAQLLHVGRNTVREAIRVLSNSDMLEVRQGDGTYVRRDVDPGMTMQELNQSGVHDQLDMQAMLEGEAAFFAALRRSDADLAHLRALLARRGELTSHPNLEAFLDADREFHLAIAAASHNSALQTLYRYFATSMRIHTRAAIARAELPEAGIEAHRRILDAIAARDPEAANAAARAVLGPILVFLTDPRRQPARTQP